MINNLWINLPVKDVAKARDFFTAVGLTLNPQYGNGPDSASFLVGPQKNCVMLFAEPTFRGFTQNDTADARRSTEVMISLGAESREEVDAIAKRAAAAGGDLFAPAGEKGGWMYGCAFADLDGHRWNVLYMDMSKLPQG
jgi:predicted lactoylglutathione lyase